MREAVFAIVVPVIDVVTDPQPEIKFGRGGRYEEADAVQEFGLPPVEKKLAGLDISCEVVGGEGFQEFVSLSELPDLISENAPVYPPAAAEAGIEGVVWIGALVGVDGQVVRACVMKTSGREDFDRESVRAALENRYSPAVDENGDPVEAWITYRVTFVLD